MASATANQVMPQQQTAARKSALLILTSNQHAAGLARGIERVFGRGVIIIDREVSVSEFSEPPVAKQTEIPLSGRALRKEQEKLKRVEKQRARTRIASKPHPQARNFSSRAGRR